MAVHRIAALAACPLALILHGCGGDGATTAAPAPTPADPTIRILEWVASNNVSLYRTKTEALIEPTQAEEGNLHFDMYEDTDPNDAQTRIWQYLVFKDTQAHKFHLASAVVKTWINEVIDPGTLTTPNTSELVFMRSVKPNDVPADCVKELPGLHVISAISAAGKSEELTTAAAEMIDTFRAASGVLYYELLAPVTSSERVFGDVAEIMWLKDEAALTALRSSGEWTNFTSQFGADLNVRESKPIAHTKLPVCGQATAMV